MNQPSVRQCDACGEPGLCRWARPGRVEKINGVEVQIPADLALIECKNCGERYDSGDDGEMLDALCRTVTGAVG